MKNFRETLWFKKGILDADLAHEAHRSGDVLATGAADLLPVEDRYADDGSVSSADSAALSLRTGVTQKLQMIEVASPGETSSFPALVRDTKRGGHKLLAMLGASVAAVALVVTLYAI